MVGRREGGMWRELDDGIERSQRKEERGNSDGGGGGGKE